MLCAFVCVCAGWERKSTSFQFYGFYSSTDENPPNPNADQQKNKMLSRLLFPQIIKSPPLACIFISPRAESQLSSASNPTRISSLLHENISARGIVCCLGYFLTCVCCQKKGNMFKRDPLLRLLSRNWNTLLFPSVRRPIQFYSLSCVPAL